MVRDVHARWNSTYIILIRALQVRTVLDEWLLSEDDVELSQYQLNDSERTHVRYLMTLLRPYLY
jgi:hypothetical protein